MKTFPVAMGVELWPDLSRFAKHHFRQSAKNRLVRLSRMRHPYGCFRLLAQPSLTVGHWPVSEVLRIAMVKWPAITGTIKCNTRGGSSPT
jgi:hypothetical protein